jgi:hypothetical protein
MPVQFGLPEGLLHEEYYWALDQWEKKTGKSIGSVVTGGAADGKGVGDGQGDGESGDGGGDGHGHGSMGDKPKCGSGWCGSGGGRPMPNEPDPNHPDGRKPAEIDRCRRHVAEAIQQFAEQGRGSVPAGWRRWADTVLEPPKVPWTQKISKAARHAVRHRIGSVDFKFRGASRKQAGVGYGPGRPVMPIFRAPIPEIEVWFDTSGSMGNADLAKGMSELVGVLKAVNAEISFGAIDADVHSHEQISRWQDAAELCKGGGGTDFAPFFQMHEKRKKKPHLIIFLTDGDAYGVPQEPPTGSDFIWLMVRSNRPPCTWGTIIDLD